MEVNVELGTATVVVVLVGVGDMLDDAREVICVVLLTDVVGVVVLVGDATRVVVLLDVGDVICVVGVVVLVEVVGVVVLVEVVRVVVLVVVVGVVVLVDVVGVVVDDVSAADRDVIGCKVGTSGKLIVNVSTIIFVSILVSIISVTLVI